MSLIKPLLASALEIALKHYLALDENAGELLKPLAGKVIAVTIQPFAETLYLCPSGSNIQVLDTFLGQVDTHLTGSVWALGLMGISNQPMRTLFSGQVGIEGNTHIGQRLQTLFTKLDINLEPKIARLTGAGFASGLFGLMRGQKMWSQQTLETFRLNMAEFLQEETRALPAAPELDIFYRQVDKTRTDYDRLQRRVERLSGTDLTDTPP